MPAKQVRRAGGKELREQSERLHLALAATGLGTWEMDLVNDRRIWSEQTRWLHGLGKGAARDRHVVLNDWLMHPKDRERLRDLHDELRAGRDDYDFVYRTTRNGEERWIEAWGTVLEREAQGPTRIVGVCADITDKKRAATELARIAAMALSSHDALCGANLDGIIETWNPSAANLFGFSAEEAIGQHVALIADADGQKEQRALLARVAAGETVGPFDTKRRRKDRTMIDVSVAVAPVKAADGSVVAISAAFHDIRERKEWEAHQRLMTRELTHRVKNSFAVLLAILRSTLSSSASPEAFTAAFAGRLHSLAAAQDILTESDWKQAELGSLARHLLGSYMPEESKRIEISGPPADLGSEYAAPFALLLNELATNAMKYGALSVPAGSIDLSWRLTQMEGNRRKLHMAWQERGGPAVRPRKQRGFGSKLIEEGIPGAKVVNEFHGDGIVCRLDLELGQDSKPVPFPELA